MDKHTTHSIATHPLPTWEELNAQFRYDPETGILYSRKSGRPYTYRTPDGYMRVRCGLRSLATHRVGWMLVHGQWPADFIDHRNGKRDDNRLCNLREATQQQSLQSRPMHKRNKLGVKGVILTSNGTYRAQLWTNGRFVLNRTYPTLAEADAVYQAVSKVIFGVWHRA